MGIFRRLFKKNKEIVNANNGQDATLKRISALRQKLGIKQTEITPVFGGSSYKVSTIATTSSSGLQDLPRADTKSFSKAGQLRPVCLVCGGKTEPIEDLGLAMQGGHIVCLSCREDYTYSIIGNSVTLRRTTVPCGWHGPIEQSYDRVQMCKSQTQSEPSARKPEEASSFLDLRDFTRAEELLKDYKCEEAIIMYNRVIIASPRHALALFGRARCHEWNRDYHKAMRDIDSALQIEPKNADFWHFRGFIYADLKDYEKAIADATKTLELSPDSYDAYYLRGRSYYELGRYEESVKDFKKCKEIQPHILNPDDFLMKIKVARAPKFEPVCADSPGEAVQILVNRALLIVPVISMETIRDAHVSLQRVWGSRSLVTGNIEDIQSVILKNLEIYASRSDFKGFKVAVLTEDDCAQISAFFQNSFIGVRIWHSHNCFCVCGNSVFMT